MEILCIEDHIPVPVSGHSSKGNQLKWELDGFWYKADGLGYEGLAEVLASALLEQSNVSDYVTYEPVQIMWQKRTYDGCMSRNFREEGWQLITVEKLYRRMTGLSLAGEMARLCETEDRIDLMVRFVRNITGLDGFGLYLARMLEMDAFFLNEDRHTNNIAVLYCPKEGRYEYCPYFDFGAGMFSDMLGDYPLTKSVDECYETICAKPFSGDFDMQTDAAVRLYGRGLSFTADKKTLIKCVEKVCGQYKEYSVRPEADAIAERVEDVMRRQIRKYEFMCGRGK